MAMTTSVPTGALSSEIQSMAFSIIEVAIGSRLELGFNRARARARVWRLAVGFEASCVSIEKQASEQVCMCGHFPLKWIHFLPDQ